MIQGQEFHSCKTTYNHTGGWCGLKSEATDDPKDWDYCLPTCDSQTNA